MRKLTYIAVFIGLALSAFAADKQQDSIVEPLVLQQTASIGLKFQITEKGDVEDAAGSHLIMDYLVAHAGMVGYWGKKKDDANRVVRDLQEELKNGKLAPSERAILEIKTDYQVDKVKEYEENHVAICDQQLSLEEILRAIHKTEPTQNPGYYDRTLSYPFFSNVDLRLMEDIIELRRSWSRKPSNQMLHFMLLHFLNSELMNKFCSFFSDFQGKLMNLQDEIDRQAKMLRLFSTPSERSLKNEMLYILFEERATRTGKSIPDILKEEIERLSEKAQDIYIPMLAPAYYLMLVLIEFQKEAPLHKVKKANVN